MDKLEEKILDNLQPFLKEGTVVKSLNRLLCGRDRYFYDVTCQYQSWNEIKETTLSVQALHSGQIWGVYCDPKDKDYFQEARITLM